MRSLDEEFVTRLKGHSSGGSKRKHHTRLKEHTLNSKQDYKLCNSSLVMKSLEWRTVLFIVLCIINSSQALYEKETFPSIKSRTFFQSGNITIAGLFPVHVGSDFRSKYMALAEAMVFAVNEVNKDPNILPNVSLGFEIYDSFLNPRLGMETALEFVNRVKFTSMYNDKDKSYSCMQHLRKYKPIPAVVGLGNSATSILCSNLLQIENIPLISYAATSDELSKVKAYPTFLRTVPPDRFQSQAMVDLAEYFNWSYIAAIAEDNAYGRSGIEYFRKQLDNRGICLSIEDYFPVGKNETIAKIQKIVKTLKELPKVEVVVLYCTKKRAAAVIEEAVKQGLSKKTWIASEAWGDTSDILTDRFIPVVKGLIGIVLPDITVGKYLKYLTELPPSYRPTDWWQLFWEDEFKCRFASNGRENLCASDLKITKEIYSRRLHSSLSTYVIEAVFAIAHALDAMHKCREPHGLLPGGRCPLTSHIEASHLLLYIKAVNITHPYVPEKQICFDANGDSEGTYNIVNLQKSNVDWDFRKVGSWVASRQRPLEINPSLIQWSGDSKGDIPRSVCNDACKPGYWQTRKLGCCWECIKCSESSISTKTGSTNCTECAEDTIPNSAHTECVKVPTFHISWAHPIGITFLSISVIGILVTIVITVIFVRYNNTPVVKASNRELCYILLFCIAMCYVAPAVYLAEPSALVCILCQMWFYLFYTTCIAILVAKTNRIVTLFCERLPRSQLTKGITGRYRHIFIVVIATLCEVIVVILWVVLDPPRPHLDKSTRTEYISTCRPNSQLAGRVCQYLLMSLLIGMSLTCCYFAYKARHLPDNFNEGKFIAFSMYVLVISWVTFYPVVLNIQDQYTTVVLSATTVIAASGLLVCMFIPKVYIILWTPEKNTRQHMQSQLTRHAFRPDNTMSASPLPLGRLQAGSLMAYSSGSPRGSVVTRL